MKNYLIIGASSGIGKSLSESLAKKGHNVFGTYNKNQISNASIKSIQFNVLEDEFDIESLPETIDGLAYCPGSINLKPFTRFKEVHFIEDYRLQVVGAAKIIQSILPKLKKSDSPSVVLFSTVAVQSGFPFHSLVSSSKGAIEGLSKALAAELAPLIRINTIAPSLTDTPLAGSLLNSDQKKSANAERNPLKKVAEAVDIANVAQFLLSEEGSYITGQVIKVDGGMSTLKI